MMPGTNPIGRQIGQFCYQSDADIFERVVKGVTYKVGFATARNVMGLIGTECNGIFVVDMTRKAVVLDEHLRVDSGWYGSQPQHQAELGRIKALSEDAFEDFIARHPRCREQYRHSERHPAWPSVPKKRSRKASCVS
jgi:hypothetical protein